MTATQVKNAPAAAGIVEELCSHPNRLAGTDAERRAAKAIAQRLRNPGRKVASESIYLHRQDAAVHTFHCLIAVAGALIGQAAPRVGFTLVFLAAVSLYMDLNGRLFLLRTLLFRRASQNVVVRLPAPEAPARVIISSTYGAEPVGWLFSSALGRRLFAGPVLAGVPFTIWRTVFFSMAVLLPTLAAIEAGIAEDAMALIQVPAVSLLLVCAFALAEVALGEAGPAANTNASGVAGMEQVLSALDSDRPSSLEVWAVALGGGVSGLESTREFLKSHREELGDRPTYLIHLESIGVGAPRWLSGAGAAVTIPHDELLQGICADLADAMGDEADRPRAIRTGLRSPTTLASLSGMPAIAITARRGSEQSAPFYRTPDDRPTVVEPGAIRAASEFTENLVRLLDREAGRGAGSGAG